MLERRVKLINCTEDILKLLLQGDTYLANSLNLNIPKEWNESGNEIFQYSLDQLEEEPNSEKWLSYLPVEIETRTLLGSCGYKGLPNTNGIVEIGYEVAKDYRNKGFATEFVEILVNNAFEYYEVIEIQAHTLAQENASVQVLKKCRFQFVKEQKDKDDVLNWKWRLKKDNHSQQSI